MPEEDIMAYHLKEALGFIFSSSRIGELNSRYSNFLNNPSFKLDKNYNHIYGVDPFPCSLNVRNVYLNRVQLLIELKIIRFVKDKLYLIRYTDN